MQTVEPTEAPFVIHWGLRNRWRRARGGVGRQELDVLRQVEPCDAADATLVLTLKSSSLIWFHLQAPSSHVWGVYEEAGRNSALGTPPIPQLIQGLHRPRRNLETRT